MRNKERGKVKGNRKRGSGTMQVASAKAEG